MSKFADAHTRKQIVSRMVARGARVRIGVHTASARVIAALGAVAVLFASHASVPGARAADADAVLPRTTVAVLVALHATPAHRLADASRTSTRWLSSGAAALPAPGLAALPQAVRQRVTLALASAHSSAPAARGYDATAPPAVS